MVLSRHVWDSRWPIPTLPKCPFYSTSHSLAPPPATSAWSWRPRLFNFYGGFWFDTLHGPLIQDHYRLLPRIVRHQFLTVATYNLNVNYAFPSSCSQRKLNVLTGIYISARVSALSPTSPPTPVPKG